MSPFHRRIIELDRQLTAHPEAQVRAGAAAQRGACSPEGFLLEGYVLSDGEHQLVWDWQREGLALQGRARRRPLHPDLAPAERVRPLEREIRLTLAAFFVH